MLETGTSFGRYRIERELGTGGMGHVYEAQDTLLRRRVALKVVRTKMLDDDEWAKEAAARLLREARAAAALRHPNAVSVFDVGEIDGVTFIAMELVAGRTLTGFTRDAALPIDRKVAWLVEIARALAAAHRAGLVHRDVKPENVMVCDDGSVKVLDFGIAKRAGDAGAGILGDGPPSFRSAEGVVTGTPRYMSPEQLAGGALDGRTDQFAWGVVAYELLSGIHPQATTGSAERWGAPAAALAKIAPTVPKELSDLVMRALERAPEHRWAAIDELVRALEAHAGIAPSAPFASDPSLAAAPAAETLRLEGETTDIAETGTTEAEADTKTAGPTQAMTTAEVALLPRAIEARFLDLYRPTWRRVLVPAFGVLALAVGVALMLADVGSASPGQEVRPAPPLATAITRIGWGAILAGPIFLLARRPRRARVEASAGRVTIRGARGMSQTLAPEGVTGASSAPLGDGRFGVVVAPKRVVPVPIAFEVATEEDAHAILAALGVSRAFAGTLSWPTRPGKLDRVAFVAAMAWRVAIPGMSLFDGALAIVVFGIAILSAVLSAGLWFWPRPGPHVELTVDQLRILDEPRRLVALRDVAEVSSTAKEVRVRLRSGETISVRAPTPLVSRRSLTAEERAYLVAHVNASAVRARAAYS